MVVVRSNEEICGQLFNGLVVIVIVVGGRGHQGGQLASELVSSMQPFNIPVLDNSANANLE